MNILKLLKNKKQNYYSDNFEKSRYGYKLKKYKNIHIGKRCFIIGNGPSLTAEDLSLLHKNNEISFASNRIYNIFDKTDWRPTYYASEDEIIVKGIEKEIEKIETKARFIPVNLLWYQDINIKNAEYFYLQCSKEKYLNKYGISENIDKDIICKGTVTATLMQIAFYMGFNEIYLIGVDHNYRVTTSGDGKVTVDNNVKDYFSEKYETGIENQLVHNMEHTTISFKEVKQYADEKNINIYNITRGGKLEVFPRKTLEDVL